MNHHFAQDSKLGQLILRSMRNLSKPMGTFHCIGELYEARVWLVLYELDGVASEIEHVLSTLQSLEDYEDIAISVKFYVISWCTLSDVLAKLVNAVFDLGIGDTDLNWMMILRNRHVRSSALRQTADAFKDSIRADRYTRLRNDIVHRGVLADPELGTLRGAIESIEVFKAIGLEPQESIEDIRPRLRQYSVDKHAEFESHFLGTITMLDAILDSMLEVFQHQLKMQRSLAHRTVPDQ